MKPITVLTGLIFIVIGILLFVEVVIMARMPGSKNVPKLLKILAFGAYGFFGLVAMIMGIARLLGKF